MTTSSGTSEQGRESFGYCGDRSKTKTVFSEIVFVIVTEL